MSAAAASPPDLEVVIVGSGFGGLCAAIQLRRRGQRSFVVLEKAARVGGTWRENHYPGCACDVPSHLYSFSFEPNPRWSRSFAPQREILGYLERCVDKYDLAGHIRFGAEVTVARWDEHAARWEVETRAGDRLTARHLILGLGALSRPVRPDLPGLERFAGRAFHSAEWDHGLDVAGRRIAVIGTGASAIQIVPQVAETAERVHVFQRTPPWVLPRRDRPVSPGRMRLFAALPFVQRLYRWLIYWKLELRAAFFLFGPAMMALAAWLGRAHIRRQIRDPRLRALVTPRYTPGCKRILLADDYYPALTRPNVEVVADAIERVTERGIVTRDGAERPVDAIVFGTGFDVANYLAPMRVYGRGGRELNDAWRDGTEAYLGTMVTGFPNLFLLTGPNTGLGHNSMVFMIEAQVRYVLGVLGLLARRGARCADVRPQAQRRFNDRLQPRLARSVWASGCKSWYLDERGRNFTLWPGYTVEFWLRARLVRAAAFELDPPPRQDALEPGARPGVGGPALPAAPVGDAAWSASP